MGITARTRAALLAAGLMASAVAARAEDGERDVWVNGLRMSADEIMLLEIVLRDPRSGRGLSV